MRFCMLEVVGRREMSTDGVIGFWGVWFVARVMISGAFARGDHVGYSSGGGSSQGVL